MELPCSHGHSYGFLKDFYKGEHFQVYQFSAQKDAKEPMIHHEVYGLFLLKRTLYVENTEFGLISKCILPSSVLLLLFLPVCAPGSQTQHPESCVCATMPTLPNYMF